MVNLFAAAGTWAGAIASFLAVLAALVVAFWQVIERRAERRRSQAAKISVWTEFVPAEEDDLDEVAHILNSSDEAIFSVVLTAGVMNKGDGQLVYGEDLLSVAVGTVAPGRWVASVPIRYFELSGMSGIRALGITFVDANGLTWQRTPRGRLTELRGEPLEALGLSNPFPHWSHPSRLP